jgi:uncharacterized protein YdhG (YjbR/CyaY superfamily)
MEESKKPLQSIEAYIAQFPPEIQEILQNIRKTIHAAAPEATEKISYGMPTFYLSGNLVHFAAFKSHIGFYPAPSGMEAFEKELSVYKRGKGSVQFPLGEPVPYELIGRIVKIRAEENKKEARQKAKKKI